MHKTVEQLLEQIEIRDQKAAWIEAEKTVVLRVLEEKVQTLAERESRIRELEDHLSEVLESRTWKMAALLQRIRLFLVPLESRRARWLSKLWTTVSGPFQKARGD
jgi:hypothetical protein